MMRVDMCGVVDGRAAFVGQRCLGLCVRGRVRQESRIIVTPVEDEFEGGERNQRADDATDCDILPVMMEVTDTRVA